MLFDIAVLLIILISAVIAFFRGLIREVLTIGGVVGGAAAALYFSPHLSPVLKDWIGTEDEEGNIKELFGIIPYTILMDIISYASIFLVVVIVLSIISYFISRGIEAIGLGAIDRSLGIVFGIFRGVILIGLLYLPVYMLVDEQTRNDWYENISWMKGSQTQMYVEKTSAYFVELLPDNFTEDIREKTSVMDEATDDARRKLEALDVLKSENGDVIIRDNDTGAQPSDDIRVDDKGYSAEETRSLEEIIEENSRPPRDSDLND